VAEATTGGEGTDADRGTDEPAVGYAQAVAELDRILNELEDPAIDVDGLAQRVRRAAELIELCRERIARARMDVEQVVATLDEPG
jgi:exodeoxyribonuclease VII small subunit